MFNEVFSIYFLVFKFYKFKLVYIYPLFCFFFFTDFIEDLREILLNFLVLIFCY